MMRRVRSPFFRRGVILPATAMAAQGAAGARLGALPARQRTGSTEQRDTAQRRTLVALGTCSELHPDWESCVRHTPLLSVVGPYEREVMPHDAPWPGRKTLDR